MSVGRLSLVSLGLWVACGGGAATAGVAPASPAGSAGAADADRVDGLCVGDAHGCALGHDGRIACWGDNLYHQVSADDTAQLDAARWVPGLSPSRGLRCGPNVTCAINQAGQIACMGFRYHQSTTVHRTPEASASLVTIALPRPARGFAVAENGGCAVLDDRSVSCWSDEDPRSPFPVPGVNDAEAVAVASPRSRLVCLTRTLADPICLRFGGRDPRNPLKGFPLQVTPLPALAGAKELLIAGRLPETICARGARARPDGVACVNLEGASVPDALTAFTPAAFVATNGALSCVREAGQVRCGGSGETASLEKAVPGDATAVALSSRHACAVVRGRVSCWGDASRGQLGDGTRYLHGPAAVPGIADATAVAAGRGVACAARKSGKLTCWGRGSSRLKVDASGFVEIATPSPVSDLVIGTLAEPCGRVGNKASCWDGERWVDRARLEGKPQRGFAPAGSLLTPDGVCAVDRKGRLGCAPACLTCDQRRAAVSWVPGPFVEVASSSSAGGPGRVACARGKDGHVSCFRLTDEGASLSPIAQPELAALADVTKLVAGSDNSEAAAQERASLTCALTRAGAVTCWANGRIDPSGAVGATAPRPAATTATPDVLAPIKIDGLPPATDLGVGGAFACAATRDGQVYCWGSNREGGAPDGAPRARPTPVTVRWPAR